jgi:hypothetical protein
MTYKNRLLDKLNLPPRNKGDGSGNSGNITEMMMDPRYLRQSATLVNEALQKGFDVLQLEDGEIVMTGTRTIVYRYYWDAEKGKLVKAETQVTPQDEELAVFETEEA